MALGRVRRSEIPESLSAPHFTEISKSDYSLRMRTLFIIPLVLMSLVSSLSWGETMDDLWEMNGIYHKKHTEVPFTGEIEGKSRVDGVFSSGKFENGKMEASGIASIT